MAILAICGPTASGKSALADRLAQELHTDVISCDSMQVYRGMDIGTAKTPREERLVPLHLVDVVDVTEGYSAALYQCDARQQIDAELAQGMVPILCGGTGLYLRAALDEMDFPSGHYDGEHRKQYQDLLERRGEASLYALLVERDPASADLIHPHNTRRVIRALEMLDEGVSYAQQHAGFSEYREHYPNVYRFALTMDRARLYRRIDQRVDDMIARGLIQEVQTLVAQGAADAITAMQAIGYKEILDVFQGTLSRDEAIDLIKRRSRRYAKRQLSWFRRDRRFHWIDLDQYDLDGAVTLIRSIAGM